LHRGELILNTIPEKRIPIARLGKRKKTTRGKKNNQKSKRRWSPTGGNQEKKEKRKNGEVRQKTKATAIFKRRDLKLLGGAWQG